MAEADCGRKCLKQASSGPVDLLVLDRKLPDMDGVRLLKRLRERGLASPAIIITGYPSLDSAVEALGWQAVEYLVKPFEPGQLAEVAKQAVKSPWSLGMDFLWEALRERYGFEHEFSRSPEVQKCYIAAARVANSDAPVLICGETGVGKEYLAKAIHLMSKRARKPFVPINCAAIPEPLLESELFGYEKGAFTSAASSKPGLVEVADGGTLFLDEIGDMAPALQAKLLRFLQDGSFRRLGGREELCVDVRIIAATNQDLERLVAEGKFRADLYYRLAVVPLYLPPLRQRPEDVEAFARYFARKYADADMEIAPDAMERLYEHDWPGNLRELDNVIRRAVLLRSGERIHAHDIYLKPIGRV